MDYKVYKMTFDAPVHFGRNQLIDSEYTIGSDTLFSALCIEALHMGEGYIDKLVTLAREDKLLLSDALPYIRDKYLLPKPYIFVERDNGDNSSVVKKAYKKLKYITADDIESYISGAFDVMNAVDIGELGVESTKVSASIRNKEGQTVPYEVGNYSFNEGCGLYVIAGYDTDEVSQLLDSLFEQLQHSGVGGERSSGYGRFTYTIEDPDVRINSSLTDIGSRYILLNTALPREDELDRVIEGAGYGVVKRSGFIYSETYSDTQQRKKDLVMFKSGSCFTSRFEGDVYDVSSGYGKHPVYRFGKPMLLRIDL